MNRLQAIWGPWARANINTFPRAMFAFLIVLVLGCSAGMAFTAIAMFSVEKVGLATGLLSDCIYTCEK